MGELWLKTHTNTLTTNTSIIMSIMRESITIITTTKRIRITRGITGGIEALSIRRYLSLSRES
jgi:hypothetical protein